MIGGNIETQSTHLNLQNDIQNEAQLLKLHTNSHNQLSGLHYTKELVVNIPTAP